MSEKQYICDQCEGRECICKTKDGKKPMECPFLENPLTPHYPDVMKWEERETPVSRTIDGINCKTCRLLGMHDYEPKETVSRICELCGQLYESIMRDDGFCSSECFEKYQWKLKEQETVSRTCDSCKYLLKLAEFCKRCSENFESFYEPREDVSRIKHYKYNNEESIKLLNKWAKEEQFREPRDIALQFVKDVEREEDND